MKDRHALRYLSGEFRCRHVERRYRDSQAQSELRQLRLIWSVALGCFLIYLPVDYLIIPEPTHKLLWARAGILGTGVAVLLLLRSRAWQSRRDWVTSLGLCLAMAGYGVVLGERGQSAGALLLLLLGGYLFSPNRFSLHCATGAAGSAAAVVAADGELPWLDASFLLPANLLAMLALAQLNRGRRRLYRQGRQLAAEVHRRQAAQKRLHRAHRQNLALLYNALPPAVATQLRRQPGRRPARLVDGASVLFADLVGFTLLTRQLSPAELLRLLDRVFVVFDHIAGRHGLEKIKTIGDAYLAVAGLNACSGASAVSAAHVALEQQRAVARIARDTGLELRLRVGLHSGAVVAGVIGSKRYAFDIWGETVNIASRLQSAAPPGGVLVSSAVRRGCGGQFQFGPEGVMNLRGCGPVRACALYPGPSASCAASRAAMSSADSESQSTVISAKRS